MSVALSFGSSILVSSSSLDGWLAQVGIDPAGREAVALRLGAFRELQDAVVAVLEAVVAGRMPPPAAVDRLNETSGLVPFSPRLAVVDGRPIAVDEPRTAARANDLLAAIARSTIRLAGSDDARRIRRCPACASFFLASRPDRIWCGASCGNRARVARYHARRRTG